MMRCWRMVDTCFSMKKVYIDRPDHVSIMPILQKYGQITIFVENDHRGYQLGPQM